MKIFSIKFLVALLAAFGICQLAVHAEGFTDGEVLFYGQVRQVGGAQATLLQSGTLEITFVNESDPTNTVALSADLRPIGSGAIKPYSYILAVPLKYLPNTNQKDAYLSISARAVNFRVQDITIDGRSATLPDGSKEFYSLSFASRASQNRLDLIVQGDSTDTDGDEMPDWWEVLYRLDINDPQDALNDPDSDAWNNLEEFQRGGNPTESNRVPQLATAEIFIPESGEAGCYLQVLDSDTPAAEIELTLAGLDASGFDILLDGERLAAGEPLNFPITELQSGRLTIIHRDRAVSEFALPLSWSDGVDTVLGEVLVRVVAPSSQDGRDASLWLDGMDLTTTGASIPSWADRSGNQRNASQPLPDHQPVVAEHSVDFGVSQNAHLFFNDAVLPVGDHTVLAAYHAAASSDAPQTLLSTNRGYLQLAPTSQAISYPGAPTYQMDGAAVRGYENSTGINVTSIFRREGSLLENIFGLSYDGESIASIAIDPVLPTLGARRSAIPSGTDPVDAAFGGQLQELLVFPSALPEQKLRDVHDYLQSKWGRAIIWDLSTGFKPVTLTATTGNQRQIIRGGHGDDQLAGGDLDDVISGGPGADSLSGGLGRDRFVFGGVDTGKDRITDFDLQADIIDLSALFWNQTGDAGQFISVRLDANFSTEIPTLDSVLIVQLADGGTQEIVLVNRVIGTTQLIQLIGEGRIRMGGLSIPSGVQIALAAGTSSEPDQPFDIIVTRSGAGTAAAFDVPLGFFEDALGGHFVVDGASTNEKRRSVVHFTRGETTKRLTVRPIPDLDTTGPTSVQLAVLPHYKYVVGGESVARTISDKPMVWLEVVEANAVSNTAQPARLRIHRDGRLTDGLTIDLRLGGTAQAGIHILPVPTSLFIPAGQSSSEIQITALAEGLAPGPKVVLFQLVSSERYQMGNPHEALLYAATTDVAANGAGFDRWLQASTHGTMTQLADLSQAPRHTVDRYLKAYAFGLDSVDKLGGQQLKFRLVDGRPEISAQGAHQAADVSWAVESTNLLGEWVNASDTFDEEPDPDGLKFVGDKIVATEKSRFYRLSMNLDPGVLTSSRIATLTNATRTGISGNATWNTDPSGGDLISSGSNTGDISRIIAEVSATAAIDFEMEIAGASSDDLLVFYINGIAQAQTSGPSVQVQQQLSGNDAHLLMWEFKRGTGNAVIRSQVP